MFFFFCRIFFIERRVPESALEGENEGLRDIFLSACHKSILEENPVSFAPKRLEESSMEEYGEETDTSLQLILNKAHALKECVLSSGNLVRNLDSASLVTLPIGITSGMGNNYIIIIEKIHWEPGQAFLEAYMAFTVPSSGERIAFHSERIPFTMNHGISGDVKMDLVSSHAIPFGKGISLKLHANGDTYIRWDCEGYKDMQVDGAIQFSDKLLVPEKPNGEIIKGKTLKADFATNITNWNNMLVQLSLDPFQINGVKGLGFQVNQAVFDFSDFANPGGVQWPENYLADYNIAANPELWRGVYIREAQIKLPPEFNGESSGNRFSFYGGNILIDDRGFSGSISAKNVFPMDKGRMDKWAYSLEEIGISVEANQLTQAGFSGRVKIPALKENSTLKYSGLINTGGEYLFSLSPTEKVDVSLFAGEIELYETSSIEVDVKDRNFVPTAILNGNMSIKPQDKNLELTDIEFQEFRLSSRAPHVSVGAFSFGSPGVRQKMQGFPLSIRDVGLKDMEHPKIGLAFSVLFQLVGEKDGAFAAEAGLTVVGRIGEDQGIQSWNYKYTHLSEATIDVNSGSFSMSGSLINFEENNTYGDGFQGNIELEIIDKFKVDATALFGKVDQMRYWYADALAELPSGPSIGLLEFHQFGGGAYFHMNKKQEGNSSSDSIGQTSTGVVYVPDPYTHLGVKARLGFRTARQEKIFNGDATLEIGFTGSGGIRNINFKGNGYFITPDVGEDITKIQHKFQDISGGSDDMAGLEKGSGKGQICAHVLLDYSVEDKTLHGNLSTYVNIGGGIIKGVGQGGLAGEAVIHFEPDKWYIHIGAPDHPVGIEILSLASMESYFMIGDEIPGSPEPPSKVSEILGDIDLSYMDDMNQLESGRGIAFGSRLSMETGNLDFLMFYAEFAAGLGYDIMLKDYQDMHCKGHQGPIGVNGWYANGQAFGYFEGEIGIKVKVFGKMHKKEILDIGAAAIVQAKLPNPSWMKGVVGGEYSILGGLVSGKCRFEIELGEECEIVGEGSVLEGIETISEITPEDGNNEINVFNTPQAVFNMRIDKEFQMVDLDGIKKSYRIKLEHFRLQDTNQEIDVNREWNDDHTVLVLHPVDILPGEKALTAEVKVSFEYKEAGNLWKPVEVDGEKLTESMESAFITGKAPDHIPAHNVKYSYPVNKQYNFYQNEYTQGYIKLIQGQDYLFEEKPEWKHKARLSYVNGESKVFDYSYDIESNKITYHIPNGLANNKIYTFELVDLPTVDFGGPDQNVDVRTKSVELAVQTDSAELNLNTHNAQGELENLKEQLVYASHFRTSYYNTFENKLNDISFTSGYIYELEPGIDELGMTVQSDEMFGRLETLWDEEHTPLVQMEANLTDHYYENSIEPLIYNDYGDFEGMTIDYRDKKLGIPPKKALYIRQVPYELSIEPDNVQNDVIPASPDVGSFVYDLIYYYANDYIDLRDDAAYLYNHGNNDDYITNMMNSSFPMINLDYPVFFKVKYVLPGTGQVTTTRNYSVEIPEL